MGGPEELDQNGTCTDSSTHCPRRAEAWERLAVEESGFIAGQQALAWEAPHLSPGDPLASCLPVLLRVRL